MLVPGREGCYWGQRFCVCAELEDKIGDSRGPKHMVSLSHQDIYQIFEAAWAEG